MKVTYRFDTTMFLKLRTPTCLSWSPEPRLVHDDNENSLDGTTVGNGAFQVALHARLTSLISAAAPRRVRLEGFTSQVQPSIKIFTMTPVCNLVLETAVSTSLIEVFLARSCNAYRAVTFTDTLKTLMLFPGIDVDKAPVKVCDIAAADHVVNP